MTLTKKIFQLFLLSICVMSCGNDNTLSITISSPENEAIFSKGQAIQITGTASDDIELVSITSEMSANNLEPVSQTISGDGSINLDFEFRYEFLDSLDAGVVYDIEIRLTAVDNEGNSATEKRKISVQ